MRGHLPLLELRRRGLKPGIVFIDTDPCGLKSWLTWPEMRPEMPTVQVEPRDNPHTIDMRFVIGMTAMVTGENADRVASIADCCERHQAGRVIALTHEWLRNGEARTTSHTDTHGTYSWHA